MVAHLERLRQFEIDAVLPLIPPSSSIVELGGGNGFQASVLTSHGHRVRSFDLTANDVFHEVEHYDGCHVPLADGSADVVFSSNVLEHVVQLPELLADVRRVLTDDGLMISVLPSATWRFWTSLAHYPFLVKFLLTRRLPTPSAGAEQVREVRSRVTLRRILSAGPHGEFRSAAHELWTFRRRWWEQTLESAGFEVVTARPLGLFYTGYSLFERLSTRSRTRMARLLGSSTVVVVCRATR